MIIGNEQDAEAGQSSLFLWDGESSTVDKVESLTFANFNPEAIAAFPDEKGGQSSAAIRRWHEKRRWITVQKNQ